MCEYSMISDGESIIIKFCDDFFRSALGYPGLVITLSQKHNLLLYMWMDEDELHDDSKVLGAVMRMRESGAINSERGSLSSTIYRDTESHIHIHKLLTYIIDNGNEDMRVKVARLILT